MVLRKGDKMMGSGGFAGRILFVDLSTQEVRREPLDQGMASEFLGGLGVNLRLAWGLVEPGIDPLGERNPIILGAGPFVGTDIPASSRVYGVSKLPANGAVGWCGGGGMSFGCQLKYAGFDHLVITGRAQRPSLLRIADQEVQIMEASDLWGRGVRETCQILWDRFGRPGGIISIGQGGENLVRFSMAYIDGFSTLGRGGFGAVMGSKNLKAILVQGRGEVTVSDKEAYRELTGKLLESMRSYPYLKEWQELGLMKSIEAAPVDLYRRSKKRRVACVSCPLGDKDILEIPEGPHKGEVIWSTSAVNLFTPLALGLKDPWEACKCVALLDELGLDMFEFFSVLSFAKRLVHAAVIPEDPSEPEIELSSLSSLETWARRISAREGLGRVLANGVQGLLEEFGEKAMEHCPPLVKGMVPYVGPEAPLKWNLFGTMELGQLLDPRGPHVATSGSPTYFAKRPLEVFPKHLKRMGVPDGALRAILPGLGTEEAGIRVGRLLKHSHRWFTILACLGICARAQVNRFYNAELCAKLYSAVTGWDMSLDELRLRADRVWTLLRLLNVREGLTRAKDSPPRGWFGPDGFRDYLSDRPLKPEEVEAMVEDYYSEQGWDPETGVPTRETLTRLGLGDL
jgi:aldehyde:ferredoxin oxidoreductase